MATINEQTTAWVDRAPVQIRRTARVAASPAAVFDVIADNERWPEWFPGFKQCAFETGAPHGAGSIRALRQDQFKVREKILRWQPGEAWSMTVIEMNVPVIRSMAENVVLTQVGVETNVDWHIGVEMAPWAKILRRPLVGNATKGLDTALANLDAQIGLHH